MTSFISALGFTIKPQYVSQRQLLFGSTPSQTQRTHRKSGVSLDALPKDILELRAANAAAVKAKEPDTSNSAVNAVPQSKTPASLLPKPSQSSKKETTSIQWAEPIVLQTK